MNHRNNTRFILDVIQATDYEMDWVRSRLMSIKEMLELRQHASVVILAQPLSQPEEAEDEPQTEITG